MEINKIIKEEFTNLMMEEYKYDKVEPTDMTVEELKSHFQHTNKLLVDIGNRFIQTFNSKVMNFALIKNLENYLIEIDENIKEIKEKNSNVIENDENLDNIHLNLYLLLDTFVTTFDNLDSLIKYNINDIYNEFEDDFKKFAERI